MLPTPKPLGFYSFLCKYRYVRGSQSLLEQCCSNGDHCSLAACNRAQMCRYACTFLQEVLRRCSRSTRNILEENRWRHFLQKSAEVSTCSSLRGFPTGDLSPMAFSDLFTHISQQSLVLFSYLTVSLSTPASVDLAAMSSKAHSSNNINHARRTVQQLRIEASIERIKVSMLVHAPPPPRRPL